MKNPKNKINSFGDRKKFKMKNKILTHEPVNENETPVKFFPLISKDFQRNVTILEKNSEQNWKNGDNVEKIVEIALSDQNPEHRWKNHRSLKSAQHHNIPTFICI